MSSIILTLALSLQQLDRGLFRAILSTHCSSFLATAPYRLTELTVADTHGHKLRMRRLSITSPLYYMRR